MEKEINVQVVSIEEEHFSIQYDKLPSSKDDIETIIGYSWIIHPEQSNVAISMWIRIQKKGDTRIDKEDIVSLRFSFNVHIDSLFSFVEKQNDKNAIKLPSTVLSTIIGDAYATGRVLLSLKLADTSLKDLYLPFNGASNFIKAFQSKESDKEG